MPNSGFYISSTNQVIRCSTTIANCNLCSRETSGVICNACQPLTYFYNNACYSPCPAGTYQHFSDQICVQNPANCKTAIGVSTGASCTEANDGYYLINNQPTGLCSEIVGCLKCSNTSSLVCTECKNSAIFNPTSQKCEKICDAL